MERQLILNRYRPLAVSGEGGSGVVELAWDTRIQRRVAIKRLSLDKNRNLAEEGLSEARTAAMLSHPSIVQVLDFETDADGALLIMECVDGESLATLLDENGPLSTDAMATVAHAVADALSYAHENQVLHLDIKPENILISRTGIVKVADFGLASLSNIEGFAQARGGTIGYMPPEQIEGGVVDQRTDEWAFASMVYEMLTCENPFLAADLGRARELAETGDIIPPSQTRLDISPGIDGVLLDALSPDPDIRPETVDSFWEHLEPFLGSTKRGRRELRELVDPVDELSANPAGSSPDDFGIGLWDRIPDRMLALGTRAVTGIGCAWLTWVGLSAASLGTMPLGIIVVAVTVAAVFAPTLGSALALLALGVGTIISSLPLAGAIVIVTGAFWWLFFGRKDPESTALLVIAPALGIAHLSCLLPLLVGFCLPWRRAVPTAMFGSLAILVAASLTGSEMLYACGPSYVGAQGGSTLIAPFVVLVGHPGTWVVIGAWVLAATLMSVLCQHATRLFAALGLFGAASIMTLGQLSAQRVTSGGVWSLPHLMPAISLVVSFILFAVLIALGAPRRSQVESSSTDPGPYQAR